MRAPTLPVQASNAIPSQLKDLHHALWLYSELMVPIDNGVSHENVSLPAAQWLKRAADVISDNSHETFPLCLKPFLSAPA